MFVAYFCSFSFCFLRWSSRLSYRSHLPTTIEMMRWNQTWNTSQKRQATVFHSMGHSTKQSICTFSIRRNIKRFFVFFSWLRYWFLGFLWIVIIPKWLSEVSGHIPIFFGTFWNFQTVDQIWPLGPLIYYQNTLKNTRNQIMLK